MRELDEANLPGHVLDVCGALVNGDNVNRRRVLMLSAAGHTATYLRPFAPQPPWELLGCEFDTGGGRTDLAWRHSQTGQVFFDEIKTHNRAVNGLASSVVAQAKRQGEGGLAQFGALFAGGAGAAVRVLARSDADPSRTGSAAAAPDRVGPAGRGCVMTAAAVASVAPAVPTPVRDAVVARVAEVKKQTGRIDADLCNDACTRLGVSPRHLRRLVTDFETRGATRRVGTSHLRRKLPDEGRAQVAYFMAAGNAVGAFKWLRKEKALPEKIDLRTFQRRVNEWDPALRACAKGGYRAMVKQQFFNREHIPYRAYAYGTDHTLLPIQVLPVRCENPVWPWLSMVICLKTRVLLSYRLTAHHQNTEDNMHVLTEAIWGRVTEGGVRIGGKPEFLRTDRGGDYISKALSLNLVEMDVAPQFTQPYSSWQNGRVEALNGTIDQDFAPTMPGYHPGGEAEYTRRVDKIPIPVESMLTIDALDARLGEFFEEYNNRVHSSLHGLTPLQAWAADVRVVPQASRATIVNAMPSRGTRTLQKDGLEVGGQKFSHPTLALLRAANVKTVEVRYHDHDFDHIEVLVDGEHECTAVRTEVQPEHYKMAVLSTRSRQQRENKALILAADRERVMAERSVCAKKAWTKANGPPYRRCRTQTRPGRNRLRAASPPWTSPPATCSPVAWPR